MSITPLDQDQRDQVSHRLGDTLFVEAGAGSGKTTALVGRVLNLVTSGTAELRSIAAITFTEKAAAELRDRIRQRLEQTVARGTDPVTEDRCRLAIDQLDGAAIGTLHAFAQRILAENAIEVSLPPRVEILDEVTSEVQFERRWTTFLDRLLEDPALERTLLLLFASGVRPDALRSLALEFDRNWDLVEERVPVDAPDPPKLLTHIGAALEAIEHVCAFAGDCTDDADKLAVRIGEIASYVRELREIEDELDLLDELGGRGSLDRPSFRVGRTGNKQNWDDVDQVRAEVRRVGDELDGVVGEVAQSCAERIGSSLRAFTIEAAAARQASGELAFHDLLVLARSLVRHSAEARQRLHQRYQRLLLDEFQDTDPIQIEIAVRIAAADPASSDAGRLPWDEVPVAAGHLFVVGDPKQSIYRFRRADISLFLAARDRYGSGDGLVTLSTNFRTGEPIIDWVNHAFDRLLGERAEVEVPVASQPSYVPLLPVRPAPPVGPAVSVVGRHAVGEANAEELRTSEARQVAATIARVMAERWSVATSAGPEPWRDARLGDVTVLVPARTSLPFLEDALDELGIPYRAESSSLVYVSRAVRDLLMVLRAIDDPTDHVSITAALRSALFACGDDDLFRFKVMERGHWNYLASQPESVQAGPVGEGLDYLRELHHLRHWVTPAALAERVARDRRLFELGFAEGRTRDVWRRLRFVIDQARAWSEATNGGLRQYLQWVNRQSSEGARVAEAVLPETDDDAVRIMTIHAAKGLEFPITVLSGMSTVPQSRPAPAQVAFPPTGGVGYKFGSNVTTSEFEAWTPIDEQMGYDERIRLLYVACTRARDHLVLSLQRKARTHAPDLSKRTNAELLVDGTGDRLAGLPDAVDADAEPVPITVPAPPSAPAPFDEWQRDLSDALRRASRPTTVAATALTADGAPDGSDELDAGPPPAAGGGSEDDDQVVVAGLEKRPRDLDLPPWLKGRYGTAVGRAVHGVLQTVALGDPVDLASVVAAQCEAEAISSRASDVMDLTGHALGSPVVRAATNAAHWREVYACTPTPGGRLLEGYIDLLYRSPAGMVVVDYKTAATSDPEELARRVDGYRFQGASYALAVGQTTGERVARVVFLFLTPGGAVEIDLPDVDAAVAEVEALIAAGQEMVLR